MYGFKSLIPSILLALVSNLNASAQITLIPSVTVSATDPLASWSGDTGTFTFFRDGPTNQTLNVFYLVGGTASNGVDYATIGNWVMIPAGIRTNTVTVAPINNGQTNIETVVVKLAESPTAIAQNYIIGSPASATVYITQAGVTNIPPNVKLFAPTNGANFFTPVDIGICAAAYDSDGYVSTVEFFAGDKSLGIRTNNPISAGPMNPFCLVWSNVPPGSYTLSAVATDNGGASTRSDPVMILVSQGPPPPPPTNFPPLVRIASPPNGAIFRAPVNVPLYAYAIERSGLIASVEFFADTNSLGLGKGLCVEPLPGGWPVTVCPTNVFVLLWSNPPPGDYVLSAIATDSAGVMATSGPVKIAIFPSPPPPTNRPAIVNIVASDPLAIEGTNCWPWLGLADGVPTWSEWMGSTSVWRFFTNCGPKNASFTVHRWGDTNNDLTVNYEIGGTATNGVDYVPLPGSVVIPAGQRVAEVTVVPLDDGPPDISSTVVLHLTGDTNYVLGYPRRAAALILDGPGPRPFNGLLSDGSFHLQASGPDGAWFHVDYSTDLLNWSSICTNQVVNGSIDFIDPDASADHSRFYRTVPQTTAPPY